MPFGTDVTLEILLCILFMRIPLFPSGLPWYYRLFKGSLNTIQVDHGLIAGHLVVTDRFDPCSAQVALITGGLSALMALSLSLGKVPFPIHLAPFRKTEESCTYCCAQGSLKVTLCWIWNFFPDLTSQPEKAPLLPRLGSCTHGTRRFVSNSVLCADKLCAYCNDKRRIHCCVNCNCNYLCGIIPPAITNILL